MKNRVKNIILFSLLIHCFQGQSQFDTLNNVLKPRIGVGSGTLAYFGEIQSYQSGFSATTNRIGGNLLINAPLNKAFNVEFSAIYGKVGANERTLERNLNFESRIRMTSLMVHYNFQPLFENSRKGYHPFLGIGFSSFEFLSKTDLYDANINQYHYWDDGSIRDLAQDDPNAVNSNKILRDYYYETDLREQNYDSLGKYREQSFAIPLSLGMEFHLSQRIDFRIATTLNYTFTDLIDNISEAGSGTRKGDSRNDFLLYNQIGISYDLEFFKSNEDLEDEFTNSEFDLTDWDKDGVIDAFDECPWSPLEALVDSVGCPIDSDKDGVPDYFDEEVTPIGNYVNEFGITITEEEFLRWQELMMDSTGLAYGFYEDYSSKDYLNKEGKAVSSVGPKRNYVVIIGKEHKSIKANDLHKYLGYREFETITKNDTVYYVLGKYEHIEDAVAAKTNLENQGVDVDEIGKVNRTETGISQINEKVIEKVVKINLTEGKTHPEESIKQVNFRILLKESKSPLDIETEFPGIENITFATGSDSITRYYKGNYDNYKDAKLANKTLIEKGLNKSSIIAYKNNRRVTLKEAGITILPKGYNEESELASFVEPRVENNNDSNSSKIDMSTVKYQILLGSFQENIPVEIWQIFMSIGAGEIKPVVNKDGSTDYYSKMVQSESEAQTLLEDYKKYPLSSLSIKVKYKGKYLSIEDFNKKKN